MDSRTQRTLCAAAIVIAATLCIVWILATRSPGSEALAQKIGLTRGVCVIVGHARIDPLRLAETTELQILVQLATEQEVVDARRRASTRGLLGGRLTIMRGSASELQLADNVADVVLGDATVHATEALRVLRPGGRAWLGRDELIKPLPPGIDDWSHPYHGPDNNPQSKDRVASAPYLTRFLAEPRYAPLPQVAVAAGGRIFKAYGHIAFKAREEPLLDTLVAYNGYNGTELWRRPLPPGLMIHRNTMIATPQTLYVADRESCMLLDAANGALRSEISPPADIAGGTFWKWMALEDGTLYALIGADEPRDPVIRQQRTAHGWPWSPLSPGFNQERNPWGLGRTLLAIDLATRRVLWTYREEQPIDSRSLCMKGGRLFFFRFGSYLGCLESASGNLSWRKTPDDSPRLFESIGNDLNRQDWRTNWRTTAYLKCSDAMLYFAGPMFERLVAVSAEDGSVRWQHDYDNYQLVLRDDALWGISGPWGIHATRKFDPLTGEVLGEFPIGRRACTRPTGSVDAILFRAQGGSVRLDVASGQPQWISPMRPQCHDGVTIAHGLLYWWPSVCDCQLTLYGITALGPAGDFDFAAKAAEAERLERASAYARVAPLDETPADWPTFRATNAARATSSAVVPSTSRILWKHEALQRRTPTAPVAVGNLVFVAGSDGVVRALDASSGTSVWNAHTGAAVRIAPTVRDGRLFVGSDDGWVYALEARSGRRLWRFRAAPAERMIPVYGTLQSTWPAASGVLVDDGVAYVAAGRINLDGTYVYALDARSGSIRWQNTTSGHLDPDARTGVSVQGHMLLHDGRLYLAGGTSLSPAVYDTTTGSCLNDPAQLRECASIYPRGWELSLIGDQVLACGQPFYKRPDHRVYDPSAIEKILHSSNGGQDIVWASNREILCYDTIDKDLLSRSLAARKRGYMIPTWGDLKITQQPRWKHACPNSTAIAHATNAVVVAGPDAVMAHELQTGDQLWKHPLGAAPVPWGLALDRRGNTILSLENGDVVCVGTR